MLRSASPRRRRRWTALVLLAAATGGCGGQRAPAAPDPAALPPAPPATAPMDLGGQKVLILPLQSAAGLGTGRDAAGTEIVFALRERDTRTQWVTPEQLQRALQRSPGYAPDPRALPSDTYLHGRERRIVEPLVGVVRRYTALMDTRLALIPLRAELVTDGTGDRGRVRIAAAVVDSRTGMVVWFGSADGAEGAPGDAGLLPAAAAAIAAALVVPDSR